MAEGEGRHKCATGHIFKRLGTVQGLENYLLALAIAGAYDLILGGKVIIGVFDGDGKGELVSSRRLAVDLLGHGEVIELGLGQLKREVEVHHKVGAPHSALEVEYRHNVVSAGIEREAVLNVRAGGGGAPARLDLAYGRNLIREVDGTLDLAVVAANVENELAVYEYPDVVIAADVEGYGHPLPVRAEERSALGKGEVDIELNAEAEVIGIALVVR